MNRIISLCPSTTYTLVDLGLSKELVGRTIFCYKPENMVDNIPKVGGTKNPKFEKIKSLKPSHILFNREENNIHHLESLEEIAETIVHTPVDVESTLKMIKDFGVLFNVEDTSGKWVGKIAKNYNNLIRKSHSEFSYLYFIWREPYMVAGKGTYIEYMLSLINGKNAAEDISQERYPRVELDDINKLRVDYIFLSTEPYPFKKNHLSDFKGFSANVSIIDGEAMSWHGTYTNKGLSYLKDLSSKISMSC